MQIHRVDAFLTPLGRRKNGLFVRLETEEGIVGWGEAYTQGDRETAIYQYVEQMSRYLVGRSPFAIKQTLRAAYDDYAGRRGSFDFYCALSGIEQAMWDIAGKVVGQPVYNLLGGACRPRVRLYANGWFWGAESPEEHAAAAEEVVRQGFTALKLYPIGGPARSFVERDTLRRAVDLVRTVRRAVGPEVDLMIDLCRRLAPMRAIEFAREIEEFHPFWLEEPCPGENLDALVEVREATDIPIVTGAAIYTKERFWEVLERGAADMINPDVSSVGGILQMREIAAMAEPYSVAVAPHNHGSTVVSTAATIHAAAGMPNFIIAEYFVKTAAQDQGFARQLKPINGYLPLPESPGLGVEMDKEALVASPYRPYDRRMVLTHDEEGP